MPASVSVSGLQARGRLRLGLCAAPAAVVPHADPLHDVATRNGQFNSFGRSIQLQLKKTKFQNNTVNSIPFSDI